MSASPELLLLDHAEMDKTHEEFIDLWQAAVAAGKADFPGRIGALLEHTERHFAREEALMTDSHFSAIAEHRADHQRVLGEMTRFARRAADGNATMARVWLKEQIPTWLDTHLRTMDSALAAHLASREMGATGS